MLKIVFASLAATLLYADFTMIYEMDSGPDVKREEVIQYRDADHVKLSFRKAGEKEVSRQAGQYIIGGRRYTVLREEGKLIYMDMDRIDKATQKLTEELNVSKESKLAPVAEKPFFTILKKGAGKTIAGIEGEVWQVESEEDGRKYQEEIVVTNNKEVVEALQISLRVLNQFGEGPYGMEIDHDLETMMLVADGYALLSAEGMVFKKLDKSKIPNDVFQLPKEAVNGMKNLPKMDREKEDAGKRLLKSMLE